MKVVIDTNIVVSAILKNRDPETVLRYVIEHPDYQWIASQTILDEYLGVLRRPKFRLADALIQEWTELFASLIALVDVNLSVDFPRDQKDAKFLACALVANADYLITGDRDLTKVTMLRNTKVCSVMQFKHLVIDPTQS